MNRKETGRTFVFTYTRPRDTGFYTSFYHLMNIYDKILDLDCDIE